MKIVVDEGRWLATEANTSVEELTQRFRAAAESDDHVLLVVEEDGELIGAIGMHPTIAKGVLSLGMWVLPEWRGRGAGRMMLEAALAARPEPIHKVELEVFPENEAAITLYRSAGFEEEGLRRDHYRRLDGSLRSSLIMARIFAAGD
jgi:RimJ/RimL family protein N-acetyltransferase